MKTTVSIGGASGFWGDSVTGPLQLVQDGRVDYLVFDYLAELTMALLAAARAKNPEAGYASDFVEVAMRAVLKPALEQGIRIISNAGGVNPRACAAALAALAHELGVTAKIAVIEGDDVLPLLPELREQGMAALPPKLLSANAYLGAEPIRQALAAGADIVITGRCVDSAVTLGALMHEFGWNADDYDLLAAGSLAGHLLECGCQGAGGLFTDWEAVPDWAHSGYPIAHCQADGSFCIAKPEGSGGLVTVATVAEQLLYEIGDPANYALPDVICDFSQVRLIQRDAATVAVAGARGRAPSGRYKVCATYADGYRCAAQLTIVGVDAARKVRRTAAAILERTRALLQRRGLPDYSATHLEVLGAAEAFPQLAPQPLFEAVMWLAVAHRDKAALELFAREIAPAGTSWAPGTTGAGGGRPHVAPVIRQCAFLLEQARVPLRLAWAGPDGIGDVRTLALPCVPTGASVPARATASADPGYAGADDDAADYVQVPLIRLAHARSGDKGDLSNIGVIARRPEYLPLLRAQLCADAVARFLAHLVRGPVTRYELPGIAAFNFVCEQALGGGGLASLRHDPLGKGMAQILLSMAVRVPAQLLSTLEIDYAGD